MKPNKLLTQDLRDSIILEALARGEEAALKRIAEKYYASLYSFGHKFCSDKNLISDCIQDIFLYFWDKRSEVTTIKSIRSYLFSALRHNLIKKIQQEKRSVDISTFHFIADVDSVVEQRLIDAESDQSLKLHLHQSVELLPKRQREALYLRYYENLSYEEIAEVMGLNRQAVANYLQYAISTLRKSWKYAISLITFLSV